MEKAAILGIQRNKVGREHARDAIKLTLPPTARVAGVKDVNHVTRGERQVALLLASIVVSVKGPNSIHREKKTQIEL